jgi:hypothetical protein
MTIVERIRHGGELLSFAVLVVLDEHVIVNCGLWFWPPLGGPFDRKVFVFQSRRR